MARGTVLLFDLDGTLVNTGGAGRRAMIGAFEKLHLRNDVFEQFNFAGMTDRAIARHGLAQVLSEIPESEIDRFLDAYVARLEEELPKSELYVVLPGVVQLLESIANTKDVAIGLGTGNIKRGAYAKLSRGKLGGAFAFGGFGCDAEDRIELLRAGAKRGAAQLGRAFEECDYVVIGDTPKDVAAAKGLGAACIAVATGSYKTDELAACGATHVVETLAVPGVRDLLLRSQH